MLRSNDALDCTVHVIHPIYWSGTRGAGLLAGGNVTGNERTRTSAHAHRWTKSDIRGRERHVSYISYGLYRLAEQCLDIYFAPQEP